MSITDSLYLKALDKPDFQAIDIGAKTGITFPYYEFYMSAGPLDPIPPFLKEVYDVGMSVWSADNLPSEWRNFLVEVCVIRETKGIKSPISPLSVVLMMLEENPALEAEVANTLGVPDIFFEEVIMNANTTRAIFNFFLQKEDLREELKAKLVDFMYYHSATWVDTYEIKEFIKKINLENGIVVDIGCGTGDYTNDLTAANRVVGLDRQYYSSRFAEEWKAGNNLFVQAEAENMPFASGTVDVVTMTSVVGHLETAALETILKEVARVLNVGGYFIVGPQNVSTRSMYRYFSKNSEQALVEITEES